jgi:hypothetical protein
MKLTDFPEVHEAFKKLVAEKEAIRVKSAPLRAKRDELLAKMAPILQDEKELIKQYLAIEEPLADLDNRMAVMARAIGGKGLSDST